MACKLLSIVSPIRFLQESSWLDIGRALYHISHGNVQGLNVWIKYTMSAFKDVAVLPLFMNDDASVDKNDIINNNCTYNYDTFGQSCITIKTLGYFAKTDNLKLYNDWHKHWCLSAMENALTTTHTDVCIALYRFYWLDFIYDTRNNKWYEFVTHGWAENIKGCHLSKAISSQFMKKFEDSRVTLSQQILNSDDAEFKTAGELTLKQLTKLIFELKKKPFKNRLMEEAQELFENERLTEFLNKNQNLTGVKNGVLEIINNDIVFRPAKPEDYISMCAGVPFNNNMHWDHPLVKECMNYLEKVFPDPELLTYFLKFCSSFFKGRNVDKIFAVFTGNGHNSKSMIVKLITIAFAVYAIKMPVGLLSEKGANSGNATPQLARAKNVKLAIFDEPEDTLPMNKGIIKRLTGGDAFYARLLHENGGDIEMTFKTIMITNEIPPVDKADEPVKDRFKIFPFLSKWITGAPVNCEEQYKKRLFEKNENFENRLPVLATPFLWILTQYYPKYCNEKLEVPMIVKNHTEEYWKTHDIYGQFITDCIIEVYESPEVRNSNVHLTLNEIFDEFRSWYRNGFPGKEVPERTHLKKELNYRWGEPRNLKWYGVTTKSQIAPTINPII
jgi:phage/plasmid-associated DNA primase